MLGKKLPAITLCCAFIILCRPVMGASIVVEGAAANTGFDVGSIATIRATVRGVTGDPARYAVFTEIQYAGTTSATGVQMNRVPGGTPGEIRFEAGWPIPAEAPTGLYNVTLRVEDRTTHEIVATQKLRSFVAYKKLLRISRLAIDKTFYNVGEPIQCEVALENLTDHDLKDLQVEFSNANYPWISLYTSDAAENPDLGLKVLRDHLSVAARSQATVPMTAAGTAAFLQGKQKEVMGAGGPVRHEKLPPPEVDIYTVAVWSTDHNVLYDMQFTTPAVVRTWARDLPQPYSRNFTHPYNSDIDFTKYREFYAPGQTSSAITVDHSHTLYRPGDHVEIAATLKNAGNEAWREAQFKAAVLDSAGKELRSSTLASRINLAPGQTQTIAAEAWAVPASLAPGTYPIDLSIVDSSGKVLARVTKDIAINVLPASLLVFCPHEDDEHSYAGLIRAAVEAGIRVRVVIFTGGDVGACERYYDKACEPNEAREFGMVRMEETEEALEHIGLTRDKVAFLGLPDGGSGAIWSRNIKASNPFLSIYLACDHAPYEHIVKPNLPYARDSVVDLVKRIIADFHPEMIATPHPDERHVDHRTTNWFVIKACQELLRENVLAPQTIVLADQAYGAGGFKAAPYKYEKAIVYLSGEASALKQEMGWIYQSQDGNLSEGMKATYAELPREEDHLRIVDWQEHAGWNE
jgi:LmbE family N-acetylglucosaminyl deacetylase